MSCVGERSSYFSIQDILAAQERVPVLFLRPVHHLGQLDLSVDDSTLPANSQLELPYWLVTYIAQEEGVAIDLPKPYRIAYRDGIMANAEVVSLNKLCNYYFEFGKLLSYLRNRDQQEIRNNLSKIFVDRHRQLRDWAQSCGAADTQCGINDRYSKLDALERFLYERGKNAQSDLNKWLTRGVGVIEAAALVASRERRLQVASSMNFIK